MKTRGWIIIRNWEKFQHPDVARNKRGIPPWIRSFTELLSNDDYLELTGHRRAVLHGLWLEYARSRCRLPLDTVSITRRLDLRVTKADLDALNHAGFIEFLQAELQADDQQKTSLEERRKNKTPLGMSNDANGTTPPPPRGDWNDHTPTLDRILKHIPQQGDAA